MFGSANGGALVGSRQVQKSSQKPHSLSFSTCNVFFGLINPETGALFIRQSYAKNLESMQVIAHN